MCVLHPPRQAGSPVTVFHPDATSTAAQFPTVIDPEAPFAPFSGLLINDPTVGDIRLSFSGEVFETEDQRNWTDASFKTYCRPQSEPKPYVLRAGDRVCHGLQVFIHQVDAPHAPSPEMVDLDALPMAAFARSAASPAVGKNPDQIVALGEGTRPALGLGINLNVPFEPDDAASLKEVRPEFLWFDLGPSSGWTAATEQMISFAAPIDATLEARIWLPQLREDSDNLPNLLPRLAGGRLVVDFEDWTPADTERIALVAKAAWNSGVALVLASRQNFTELNRVRPPLEGIDGVGFAVCPQIHAIDDRSILENADGLEEPVRDARVLADGRPLHVGPLSLAHRGALEDPRAREWLGAAYLIRSLVALTRAGAASASWFYLNGPGGVRGEERWMPCLETLAALRRSAVWRIGTDPATRLSVLDAGRFGTWLVNPLPRSTAVWTERAFVSTAGWRTGRAFESHPGEPMVIPPMEVVLIRWRD